jgi:hypothetical protein
MKNEWERETKETDEGRSGDDLEVGCRMIKMGGAEGK